MIEDLNLEDIFSKANPNVYFVGIGGIGMSAAANIAEALGFKVSGSDKGIYSPTKEVLDQADISYFTTYDASNVKASGADLFVISAGENFQNPEVGYIIQNNLPHCGLAQFLYNISKEKLRVVVTGTHGKSTTAGLLGYLLQNLDDSSFMAGGVLQSYDRNFNVGDGHYFVFEGDEYKEEFDDPTPKFHYYKADILVLTNLEYDHPDLFPNFEALENEFRHLITNLPQDGLIVYNGDDANLSKLVHESNVSSVSFGIENEADFKVEQIKYEHDFTNVEVINKFSTPPLIPPFYKGGKGGVEPGKTEQYKTQLPGKMNVYNALAAIATLRSLGFAHDQIALDLLSFKGIKRRFEIVGEKNGITIVDDYAHHPTAVRETLEAARLKYFPTSNLQPPTSKLWAIFEPHTFSRTKATISDLAKSFEVADEILISEIYPARENKSDASITSTDVVQALGLHSNKLARLVHNKSDALKILKSELKPGDVVIVMAVGDFNRLAYDLKESL